MGKQYTLDYGDKFVCPFCECDKFETDSDYRLVCEDCNAEFKKQILITVVDSGYRYRACERW